MSTKTNAINVAIAIVAAILLLMVIANVIFPPSLEGQSASFGMAYSAIFIASLGGGIGLLVLLYKRTKKAKVPA